MMHDYPPVYLSKQYWLDKIEASDWHDSFEIIDRLLSDPYAFEDGDYDREYRVATDSCKEKQRIMYNLLITDKEIITALIRKDGHLICKLYSSSKMNNWIQTNLELFEVAIQNCRKEWQVKYIVEISGSILRENKEFMQKVIEKDGSCIRYASDAIRTDKDFVKLAIEYYGKSVFLYLTKDDIFALLE
jgi:hypothetical protein